MLSGQRPSSRGHCWTPFAEVRSTARQNRLTRRGVRPFASVAYSSVNRVSEWARKVKATSRVAGSVLVATVIASGVATEFVAR